MVRKRKKLPRGLRKHIRDRKADFKREAKSLEDLKQKTDELYRRFTN